MDRGGAKDECRESGRREGGAHAWIGLASWAGGGRADERVHAEAKEVSAKEGVVGRHDVGRYVGCVRAEHCCRGINEGVMGGLEGG